MKKSVIALAAMAVVGGASAQVSISGIMDGYIGSGNQFGQKISLVGQSGARTTTFKFNGSENLGGGRKANFQFEIQPQFVASDGNQYNTSVVGAGLGANGASQAGTSATGNQISSGMAGKGQSYLGLEASGFDVRIGTNNVHGIDVQVNGAGGANGFGTAIGSGYGAGYGSTSQNTFTRFEESISIRSPIMNGAQVKYLTNLKNDKSYGSTTGGYTIRRPAVSEWGAEYKNGPLQLDAALLSVKNSDNEATSATTTSTSTNYTALTSGVTTKYTSYSASYDLGVARLGFISQKVKNDATTYNSYQNAVTGDPHTEAKWQMVTANIPLGAFRVLVGAGKYTLVANPATLLNGAKNSLSSFALEYDLSKRTYAYLRFQQGSNGATNAATTLVNGVNNAVGSATASGLTAAQLTTQTFNLGGIGISHAF